MRSPIRLCPWALLIALGLVLPASPAPPGDGAGEAGPVAVTLRPAVRVAASPVCVGHIASLSGGTAALRQQIAGLDLADRPRPGKPLQLLRELIAYRIQVAGIDRSRFRVQGASVVQVGAGDASLGEDDLFEVARDALLETLHRPADDVTVTLAQAPAVPQVNLAARDEFRLDAEAREPLSVPGRVRVDVAIRINGERQGVVPVLLDVKVNQAVAVAVRRIEAGEELAAENVRFERQVADDPAGGLTAADVAAGKKARRALAAGQVVAASAVEPARVDNPILVKQRDLVRLIARVGTLRVTALAEAQQDGHAGDRVRVRNVDSRKDVVGRVVGRGLVEVEY